jgi:hypothetical protein
MTPGRFFDRGEERLELWTMGGGEAALLAVAVALAGWIKRRIVVELAEPIRVGPFTIRPAGERSAGHFRKTVPHPPAAGRLRLK